MRKLLAIFGAVGLTATTGATLVACNNKKAATDEVDSFVGAIKDKTITIELEKGTTEYKLDKDAEITATDPVAKELTKEVTKYAELAKGLKVTVKDAFSVTTSDTAGKKLKLNVAKDKKNKEVEVTVKVKEKTDTTPKDKTKDDQTLVNDLKTAINGKTVIVTIAKDADNHEFPAAAAEAILVDGIKKQVTNYDELVKGIAVTVKTAVTVAVTDADGQPVTLTLTKGDKTAEASITVKVVKDTK